MWRSVLIVLGLSGVWGAPGTTLVIVPASASAAVGETVQFTTTPVSADDPTVGRVRWSSDNPWIGSVDQTGRVTGVSVGTTTIRARAGNDRAVASVQFIVPVPPTPPGAVADSTAASCSQAHVQAAANAVTDTNADGKIVLNIPAGECTWDGSFPDYMVAWTNKNLHVRGAGQGQTILNCEFGYCFSITSTSATNQSSQWSLSHMTLQTTETSGFIVRIFDDRAATVPNSGWRIHHITWNHPVVGGVKGIFISGATYGLIDHNTVNWRNGSIFIQAASFQFAEAGETIDKLNGEFIWKQPLDYGTGNFVFIEDNTFNNTSSGATTVAVYDTSNGGHRAVFRYNTVYGGHLNHHRVRGGDWCGTVMEVYKNRFVGMPGVWSDYTIRLDSGTMVYHDNHVTDHSTNGIPGGIALRERRVNEQITYELTPLLRCDGTEDWDGNFGDPDAPGWPCLGQIGRSPGKTIAQIMAGDKQASSPLYVWRNGTESSCITGGACTFVGGVDAAPTTYIKATTHPNGDVDYVLNTPMPGYTEYPYPHPLQAVQ